MRRSLRHLALTLLLGASTLVSHSAIADSKAESKAKKLQGDAMDVDFLSTDFKAAQKKLEQALKECGDTKCSGGLVAALHRDLGVVLVNAKDSKGGQAQFEAALTADGSITVGKDYLADAKVKAAWDAAKKKAAAVSKDDSKAGDDDDDAPKKKKKKHKGDDDDDASAAKKGDDDDDAKKGDDDADEAPKKKKKKKADVDEDASDGALAIEFKQSPVGYAFPIVVKTPDGLDITVVKLAYKTASMEKFKVVEAKKDGDRYVATIGCEDAQFVGDIKLYVRAYDDDKNEVEHFGSIKKPIIVSVVDKLPDGVESPAYPGGKEPAKCTDKADCQPGFPCDSASKKPQGSGCESDDECQSGLSCVPNDNGTKWCYDNGSGDKGDADKGDKGDGDDDDKKPAKKSGPYKKFWVGIDVELDIMDLGQDSDLCNLSTWACSYNGTDVGYGYDANGNPSPPPASGGIATQVGGGGNGGGGIALGTVRFLASFDYFLSANFSLGARLGYAVGGNPTTSAQFMPYHAELRAQYFLSPISSPGLKGYLDLGGGFGEFDAKLPNLVVAPLNASDANNADGFLHGVSAYRLAGQGFVGVGGGIWYMFSQSAALNLGARLLFTMPTFAFGVAPELGVKFGF